MKPDYDPLYGADDPDELLECDGCGEEYERRDMVASPDGYFYCAECEEEGLADEA